MKTETCQIEIEGAYDLFGTLRFARFGKWDPTFSLSAGRMERVLWFRGSPALLTARLEDRTVVVKAVSDYAEALIAQSPALLGLNAPNFEATGHPLLEVLTRRYAGVRRITTPHLGFDLIQTVMQQLIEWREAAKAWRKLVIHFGAPAPMHHLLRLPPSYDQIARASLDTFQKVGISIKRGRTIRELARIGLRIDQWRDAPLQTLRSRLHAVEGLGPWTIEHCLGFSLGAADVVPLGDYQLPRTVCWALTGMNNGTDADMIELLEPWRGHRWSVLRLLFASNLRPPRRGPRIDMGRAVRPSI